MLGKVLIADSVAPLLIDGLKERGFQVVYSPDITLEETREVVQEYFGLVINTKTKMTRDMFEKAAELKFVARLGAGLDIIDMDAANDYGVYCFNTPEGNRNAVAEQGLGVLLSLLNKVSAAFEEIRSGQWNREFNRGVELDGKTIGLLGFGNNGQQFANLLSGFNVKIIACDPFVKESPLKHVQMVSENELLEQTQVLSLHPQLTDQTYHWLNRKRIEKFKNPFVLINMSRGAVVDTKEVLAGLKSGKILAAGLDVLENEKLETYSFQEKSLLQELCSLRNVIITPHVAGWTVESKIKIAEWVLRKIDKVFKNP